MANLKVCNPICEAAKKVIVRVELRPGLGCCQARRRRFGMTHMPAHPVGGIAVLPIPGSAAAGVAIAPIATNFGGEVVNTFIGREICKAVDGAEAKLGEKVQIVSREFCNKDMRDIGQSGESYFPHCRPADQKADLSQMKEGIKRTYVATGSAENQYRGQDPYKE